MIYPKCKNGDFDKLQVIESKINLVVNVYTDYQEARTLLTIKCLDCNHEFQEEV